MADHVYTPWMCGISVSTAIILFFHFPADFHYTHSEELFVRHLSLTYSALDLWSQTQRLCVFYRKGNGDRRTVQKKPVLEISIKECVYVRMYKYKFTHKYDRDYLCVNKSQFVPVIFEPPCAFMHLLNGLFCVYFYHCGHQLEPLNQWILDSVLMVRLS